MATGKINKVDNDASSYSSGGYCKMLDGTLIQWGSATITSGSYTENVQLPVAFIDKTKIGVSVTTAAVSEGVYYGVNYNSVTESQLSFGRTPNTATNTIYWIAIGRWK